MKHLVRFSILFFYITLSLNLYANSNKSSKPKDSHLSYNEMIELYGVDDTSLAIIDMYYEKRINSGIGKMSFLPLSIAVTVVIPPLGMGLVAISSPLFVSGLITKHKYSQKKLLKTLFLYHNFHQLSIKERKKIKDLILVQQETYKEKLNENNIEVLESIRNEDNLGKMFIVIKK